MAERLLDVVRRTLRTEHYGPRTEEAYLGWIVRFLRFHRLRHPRDMAAPEVEAFLSHLANEGRVAAATQNQALAAILFLYGRVIPSGRSRGQPAAVFEPPRDFLRIGSCSLARPIVWWLHLLSLFWAGVGAAGCWHAHRRAPAVWARILCFSVWTLLCFLPVAWFEGRTVYWWSVQPSVGEALVDVESRLGAAVRFGDEAFAIAYRPPRWWILPVFGHVVIRPDRDGRVETWTVDWR